MKYHFIVNPHSGNGSGQKVWEETEAGLKERSVDYDVFFTKHMLDAKKRAAEITAGLKEEEAVITVGGDGTINECLNGLDLDSPVIFGFIPSGSGNDLGRSLGANNGVEGALKRMITSPSVTKVDYGVLTTPDGENRRFAVSCGIGFDAAVCHGIEKSKLKSFFNRLNAGKAVYTAIGFGQYLKARPTAGSVVEAGEKADFRSLFFISCQIHPYEGGGYHFAPNAVWNDGKIDITVVNSADKLKLFPVLIDKKNGVKENSFIKFYSCTEASVKLEKALPVHADGELMGVRSEFSVRCVHGRLRMFI